MQGRLQALDAIEAAAWDQLVQAAADRDHEWHAASLATGREYFAMIQADVLAIGWLELHATGHRRARFEPGTARWLQP